MKTLLLETPNGFKIETQVHPSRRSFLAWIRKHMPGCPKAPSAFCCMFEDKTVRIVITEATTPYSADVVHEYLHAVDFLSPRIPRALDRVEVRAYLLNALLEFHKAWFENRFETDGIQDTTARWYLATALSYTKELD